VVRLDRAEKARMIEEIVAAHRGAPVTGLRILDIGCGNGDIARHFAAVNRVVGVDVQDQRRPGADFEFHRVASARLPFADGAFDLVISNHVIEHVPEQGVHLDEVGRVLAPGGIAYLATPNRTSPMMEGHVGNPHVLRWRAMAPLFHAHGFRPREVSVDILAEPNRFHGEVRYARWLPRPVLHLLRPLFPSHIFILEPAAKA
jgi:2-polyprenyl-3-methyl-5-hydroxy-6-metoxy-1,4-benzoquinol methylase